MANIERLTKRVKIMEDWIAENEEMGGPRGMLDTMSFLVQETRRVGAMAEGINVNFVRLQNLNREFLINHELGDEWNEFIQEKEKDAHEKQTAEKVPSRKKAETGKKVGKENSKKAKTSKKSKKE